MARGFRTGYVHGMLDDNQTFEQFVMSCARAFGALILMRDDPKDAPIPEEFKPDGYYYESVIKAQAEMDRINSLTPQELAAEASAKREAAIREYEEGKRLDEAEQRRVGEMRARVEAWTPPTAEHANIKSFMLEQLWKYKPSEDYGKEQREAPTAVYAERIKQNAKESLAYAKESLDKQEILCASRTLWVKQLRESLA